MFGQPGQQVQPEPLVLARQGLQLGFGLGQELAGGIQHHRLLPQPAVHQLILRHVTQLGI
ncbi:hypothetical protein D3C84_1244010 [compost metagenome]